VQSDHRIPAYKKAFVQIQDSQINWT
jgi:hypothetical protein